MKPHFKPTYNREMLIQIANLLLQVLISIVAGACLLRCYLQWLAFNLGSGQSRTIGAYVLPLSNWIVIPLRKLIPSVGRLDVASFLAAYLLVAGKTAILLLLSGATLTNVFWPLLALTDLVDLILSGLVGLVFASVILTWVSAGSQIKYLVSLLVEPLLAPIRKAMPNFGALDLSPLLLLLILQVLQIVVSNLR